MADGTKLFEPVEVGDLVWAASELGELKRWLMAGCTPEDAASLEAAATCGLIISLLCQVADTWGPKER